MKSLLDIFRFIKSALVGASNGNVDSVRHKKSPLKYELKCLKRKVDETNERIDDMRDQAIAAGTCPCCVSASLGGSGGLYSRLIEKNERRQERIKQIEAKLTAGNAGRPL